VYTSKKEKLAHMSYSIGSSTGPSAFMATKFAGGAVAANAPLLFDPNSLGQGSISSSTGVVCEPTGVRILTPGLYNIWVQLTPETGTATLAVNLVRISGTQTTSLSSIPINVSEIFLHHVILQSGDLLQLTNATQNSVTLTANEHHYLVVVRCPG
jgi:hypothetical protein